MQDIMLDIQDLTKIYEMHNNKVTALDKISFSIKKGEIVAIMGTSGSGKSTLLNILGALDKPTKGTIKLNGKDIKDVYKEPSASMYRRENIGFIFQSYNLLKDITIEENIALPLILKNESDKVIKSRTQELINALGLKKFEKHRPVQLSGGQQQRVAIARALIVQPPIILADEPTGNLDFNMTSDILQLLVDTNKRYNQTILMVTHDPNVATYADRVIFFHDGSIVDTYTCKKCDTDIDQILLKIKQVSEI